MPAGFVREAKPEDVENFHNKVRPIDLIEIEAVTKKTARESLLDCFNHPNAKTWSIVKNEGDVVGMFGVSDCHTIEKFGVPFLISSDEIIPYATLFLKNCAFWVEKMQGNYEVLYNFIHSENKIAMNWLKWCGFSIETGKIYNINNIPFYLFVRSNPNKNK